jgi:hypothetical protein
VSFAIRRAEVFAIDTHPVTAETLNR